MASSLASLVPVTRPQKRFSVQDYHRMMEHGLIASTERLELIHGLLVEKPAINPGHAYTVGRLTKKLFTVIGDLVVLRVQVPITLPPDSEPEPDLLLAYGAESDYMHRHPGPRDIAVVIEVADHSLAEDRTVKLALYAAARIPEYWIVNLVDRQIEVHTEPRAGKSPIYRRVQTYAGADAVPVRLSRKKVGAVPAAEIFPR